MVSTAVQPPVLPSGPAVPGVLSESRTILRLAGELRGTSRTSACAEGTRFVLDLDATVTDGVLAGGRSTGFGQFTLGRDGSVRLAGSHIIASGDEAISLTLHGVVAAHTDECLDEGEFPDRDYPLHGSALIHAEGDTVGALDGTVAAVRGWVNFESGEVEVEALA